VYDVANVEAEVRAARPTGAMHMHLDSRSRLACTDPQARAFAVSNPERTYQQFEKRSFDGVRGAVADWKTVGCLERRHRVVDPAAHGEAIQ